MRERRGKKIHFNFYLLNVSDAVPFSGLDLLILLLVVSAVVVSVLFLSAPSRLSNSPFRVGEGRVGVWM